MCLNLEETGIKRLMEAIKKEFKNKDKKAILQCYQIGEHINMDMVNNDLYRDYEKLISKVNNFLYE